MMMTLGLRAFWLEQCAGCKSRYSQDIPAGGRGGARGKGREGDFPLNSKTFQVNPNCLLPKEKLKLGADLEERRMAVVVILVC